MENLTKRLVNILWTGGLDSTFRVAELSRMEVIVQPYYLQLRERHSYKYELRAVAQITRMLRENPLTKAEIRDVIVVDESTLVHDDSIFRSWDSLHRQFQLGTQYELIACFLDQYHIQAEAGVLFTERGKISSCLGLRDDSLIRYDCPDGYSYFMANPDTVRPESLVLFQNMIFPVSLRNKTKVEEADGLRKLGLEDVYRKTWFCHMPVFGLPCGRCNPCKDCKAEGMPERMHPVGTALGIVRSAYLKVVKLFS